MSRIEIAFPEEVLFSTELEVHQCYINRGNHVGNSQYVELCNETALRFFQSRGAPEYTIGQRALLNVDFSVQLRAEARHLDRLIIDMAADGFHDKGCELLYRFRFDNPCEPNDGKLVALARFSFLCFDYVNAKVAEVDDEFRDFFQTSRIS